MAPAVGTVWLWGDSLWMGKGKEGRVRWRRPRRGVSQLLWAPGNSPCGRQLSGRRGLRHTSLVAGTNLGAHVLGLPRHHRQPLACKEGGGGPLGGPVVL